MTMRHVEHADQVIFVVDGAVNEYGKGPFSFYYWGYNPTFNREQTRGQCFYADMAWHVNKARKAGKDVVIVDPDGYWGLELHDLEEDASVDRSDAAALSTSDVCHCTMDEVAAGHRCHCPAHAGDQNDDGVCSTCG